MVQEVSWIAVKDHWRRGTVKMLFEEVQSMSEHHKVDEVQGKSVKQNNNNNNGTVQNKGNANTFQINSDYYQLRLVINSA